MEANICPHIFCKQASTIFQDDIQYVSSHLLVMDENTILFVWRGCRPSCIVELRNNALRRINLLAFQVEQAVPGTITYFHSSHAIFVRVELHRPGTVGTVRCVCKNASNTMHASHEERERERVKKYKTPAWNNGIRSVCIL